MKVRSFLVLLFLPSFFLLLSCSNKSPKISQKSKPRVIDSDSIYSLNEKFNEAKQIVYSLPSPQEVSLILLDNKNISYNPELMNKYTNVDKYTSDLSRALNLGIYSADISYSTIFNQNQTAINYISAAKKLAEQLGILNYFSQNDIQEIENNITNRDEVMKVITQAYMKSDAKLQQDKRDDIGALILIGGWIEGMYLAVNLAQCNAKSNPQLINAIMEQQLSLSLLVDFLNYYKNNKLLSDISSDIIQLNNIFQSTKTNIDSSGNIIVSEKDFKRICKKINQIRNTYVNLI